jgi:dihydroflavonol-4-reductase
MKEQCLVVGANGHLGNNLVRELLTQGYPVRASVRNLSDTAPFDGLKCEVVKADLLDKGSLKIAMKGIDWLFIAAAVYKSWAVDIEREIVRVNIQGTRNVLEAASEMGIKKTIYVSTSFAADHKKDPIDENGWNTNYSDPYRLSKTEAEKLAWDLASRHDLWLVSVLPSALVGPHCYGHMTPSMGVLHGILHNRLPIDPDFYFNFIDIRDVSRYLRLAAEKGKRGERYLLSQQTSISSTEVFKLAHSLYPEVRIPKKVPYPMMLLSATLMALKSKWTKQPPLMLSSQVKAFYRADKRYDTAKAQTDLGFSPRPQAELLKETMRELKQKPIGP